MPLAYFHLVVPREVSMASRKNASQVYGIRSGRRESEYKKGCRGPRNITCEDCLIESDPWHVGEENKMQMLGTTRSEIVLEHPTRGAAVLLAGQQGRRVPQVRKSMHHHIPKSRGLPFVRPIAGPSSLLHDHRNFWVSE